MPDRLRILVVDDESTVRRSLRSILVGAGHEVVEAAGVRTALKAAGDAPLDVALVDHHLDDGDAPGLMRGLREIAPSVPVVVLTGDASIDLAVEIIRHGAHNFLVKPPEPARLVRALESAAASRGGVAEGPTLGGSAAARTLSVAARRAVEGMAPVLLEGETGTGKSTLARWIHGSSSRAKGPFLDLSAADPVAMEAELFGSETAGTRGRRVAQGLIERAAGGALFVDEVADLKPSLQARLAKVIEEGLVRRAGGLDSVPVDVRLFAATSRELGHLVAEGRFRSDLYFRIGAAPIRLAPLRDRLEDLPELVGGVLRSFGPARERGASLSPDALEALASHGWPGNLRELRQVVERAVLVAPGPVVHASDLSLGPPLGEPRDAPRTLAEVEREHVLRTLNETGFDVGETSRRLGVPRSTLYDTLKRYGVELPRGRRSDP